jgi:tRNA 5-methylaminomethyl-2-thiouridine biosynthesis bifunctional protein
VNTAMIKNARLDWNDNGTPVSREFGDVYFSNDDGLAETQYVFLTGNDIPARFFSHRQQRFTIAETGFGTGLNFLTAWRTFRLFRQDNPQATLRSLHFISVEKYPLQLGDLIQTHRPWPALADLALQLHQQWPSPYPGCHRLIFEDGAVVLDLWLGDVNDTLPQLEPSYRNSVDAWFLDGFAPSKNPDMWSQSLFNQMMALAKPNSTFATFTAAGFVRRGLQQAGFSVKKIKGFGHKREMLTGVSAVPDNQTEHNGDTAALANREENIAIIGGGIASALTALALLRRGVNVTLYCADEAPARGASGNKQGALYPLLNSDEKIISPFFALAFSFARRQYELLARQGLTFGHDWCGVVQPGYDEKSLNKIDKVNADAYPDSLVYRAAAKQMDEFCGLNVGYDGLVYPEGGWLCPQELTVQAIALAERQGARLVFNCPITALEAIGKQWKLTLPDSQSAIFDKIILANGHRLTQFHQSQSLPLYPVRGQVSHIPDVPPLSGLKAVLCYDGYLTPRDPHDGSHCLGASYVRGDVSTDYRHEEQLENVARIASCFKDATWINAINIEQRAARVAVRCAVRDHMPMVGGVPNANYWLTDHSDNNDAQLADVWPHLFMIGALGSRGLCSAPLLAEVLACQICAEPVPLSDSLLNALNPARIWQRKRQKSMR